MNSTRSSLRPAAPLLVLATFMLASSPASAETVLITSDTTIEAGDTSLQGDDVVVEGAILTLTGTHSFASLTVRNDGVVTHPVAPAQLLEIHAQRIVIDEESAIDVSGKGLAVPAENGGGSHGGLRGRADGDTAPNATYGDKREPRDLGTGASTVRGGGAVKLVATQSLRLAGSIRAEAESSEAVDGGSGGSISIVAAGLELAGGAINADGGRGSRTGGGGGRVAVSFSASPISVQGLVQQIYASGGWAASCEDGEPCGRGEDGSIWIVDQDAGQTAEVLGGGQRRIEAGNTGSVYSRADHLVLEDGVQLQRLVVDGGVIESLGSAVVDELQVLDGGSIEFLGALQIGSLQIMQSGNLAIRDGISVASMTMKNLAQSEEECSNGSTLEVRGPLAAGDVRIEGNVSSVVLSPQAWGSLSLVERPEVCEPQLGKARKSIEHNWTTELRGAEDGGAPSLTLEHLRVESGRTLATWMPTLVSATTSIQSVAAVRVFVPQTWGVARLEGESRVTSDREHGRITIDATSLHIGALASIHVDNLGRNAESQYGYGAAYGGEGTNEQRSVYGSIDRPVDLGVGGDQSGRGGGAIHLRISGELVVDGAVRANAYGEYGDGGYYAGGTGGSILIEAGNLAGSGAIEANGYAIAYGAGSGGRVAIHYGQITFDRARVRACGAISDSGPSASGTVFFANTLSGERDLVVDGCGNVSPPATPIAPAMWSSAVPYRLDVRRNASAVLRAGTSPQRIRVDGARFRHEGVMQAEPGRLETVNGAEIVHAAAYETEHYALSGDVTALVAAPQPWREVTLSAGARLGHPEATSHTDPAAVLDLNLEKLTIHEGAAVDATNRGHPDLTSHAGLAGPTGHATGNIREPTTLGAGGRIKLRVGHLVLHGEIRANAKQWPSPHQHIGAAGSVWLDVGILEGRGRIRADAENGTDQIAGRSGGGGRVAVYVDNAQGFDLLGQLSARGGAGTLPQGGAGTVYVFDRLRQLRWVAIDNGPGGESAWATPITENLDVPLVIGRAHVTMPNPITLADVSFGNAFIDQQANASLGSLQGLGGKWRVGATLTLPSPQLDVGAWTLLPQHRQHFRDIHLREGGVVSQAHWTTGNEGVFLWADRLRVDGDAAIDVSGLGQTTPSGISDVRNGGSHGGRGGVHAGSTNAVFGSATQPTAHGVGGGGNNGNRGGGRIRIEAGRLRLDGPILADGQNGAAGRGGGSGGSVWLSAGSLTGSGLVRAAGGRGQSSGGGGGGRIAIEHGVLEGFEPLSSAVAPGGTTNSAHPGLAGSVSNSPVALPFRVVELTPETSNAGELPQLIAYFTQSLDAASISVADVTIEGPAGPITVAGVHAEGRGGIRIVPASALTAEGTYSVRIGPQILSAAGVQMNQDADASAGEPQDDTYVGSVTIDRTPPPVPQILNAEPMPTTNRRKGDHALVWVEREADSEVWINGMFYASAGSGRVPVLLNLPPGHSFWEVVLVDRSANVSGVRELNFFYESPEPAVVAMTPRSGSCLPSAPAMIDLETYHSGSGIRLAQSTLAAKSGQTLVAGEWSLVGNSEAVRFTPQFVLGDTTYEISATLRDGEGRASGPFTGQFTVDTNAPAAPTVSGAPAATVEQTITVTGTREAGTAVLLNGALLLPEGISTSWSRTIALQPGANRLAFRLRDCAGNLGAELVRNVHVDSQPPLPVAFTVEGHASGTSAMVSWSGYNQQAAGGDIDGFDVYWHTAPFTVLADATNLRQVAATQSWVSLEGLQRGATYHVAVVARDRAGLVSPSFDVRAVTLVDSTPPSHPRSLQIVAGEDFLDLTWAVALPVSSDLDKVRVRIDGEVVQELAAEARSTRVSGLAPARSYRVSLSTVDTTGNQAHSGEVTAVTWLANPAPLAAVGRHSRVDLSWPATQPAGLVKRYRVYQSAIAFTDVSAMTPIAQVSGTSHSVTGLSNGVAYHFAVTAQNLSDGERPSVTSVSAIPQEDNEPPTITALSFEGVPLTEGQTLTRSGTLRVTASDANGIARADFTSSGSLNQSATGSALSSPWSLESESDGPTTLTVRVTDALGNVATEQRAVTILLDVPPSPTLTAPANGLVTNQSELLVRGNAARPGDVVVSVNEVAQPAVPVDANGQFAATVPLTEGANTIIATARNNRGRPGGSSAARTVTRDSSVPPAPASLNAIGKEGGVINLSWSAVSQNGVNGYDVYRASSPFESVAAATRLTQQPITATRLDDLPPADGVYHYRVVSRNLAGSASPPSVPASATSDRVAPEVLRIEYLPEGPHSVTPMRLAPGGVGVRVHVSEPLLTTPFLTMTPEGGVPIAVSLAPVSALEYEGSFTIGPFAKTGPAFAVFSARDTVGNRGTRVRDGATLAFDTEGPRVTSLNVEPAEPIRADAQPQVSATFDTDEDPANGELPQVRYRLSGPGRSSVPIAGVQALGARRWRADFTLPADAGAVEAETLSFEFDARDDLGNSSPPIDQPNAFQVYRGNLPPLAAPRGLTAKAAAQGYAELEWRAVEGAAGYEVWRRAASGGELLPVGRTEGELTYRDLPSIDGEYEYGVASIRRVNGQEAVSGTAERQLVRTDRLPPAVPANLRLRVTGSGVIAEWDQIDRSLPGDADAYFRLYRSSTHPLVDVTGLAPIRDLIGQPHELDGRPSAAERAYAVTARDRAGNESAASASVYLNVELLPVASLSIDVTAGQAPVIRWSHPSATISGYHLDAVSQGQSFRLLDMAPRDILVHTDAGHDGGERRYRVIAIDDGGAQSLPRELLLPAIEASVIAGQTLRRGLMNGIGFLVHNAGPTALEDLQLRVELAGRQHVSAPFAVAAGGESEVRVVIPGYANLDSTVAFQQVLRYQPNQGERVDIVGSGSLDVGDGGIVATLETETFTRGGEGRVRVEMENPGDAEIEWIAASNGQPSPDARMLLLDEENNVLATHPFLQPSGQGVVTLPNGRTVVRIPAGGRFVSSWQTLSVPPTVPDRLRVSFELDALRHGFGEAGALQMPGLRSSREVSLTDTAYYGELLSVSPANSFGDRPITLRGRVRARVGNLPQPGVPVKLVLRINGFERVETVTSDGNGDVAYTFTPLPGESGRYRVSIVHPDILDRPEHGEFTIQKVSVSPAGTSWRAAYGQTLSYRFTVRAGPATNLSQVRLALVAEDQLAGQVPAGLTFAALSTAASIAPGQSAALDFSLRADESVPASGSVVLRVVSAESGALPLARIPVDYEFASATPRLSASPQILKTGMSRGESVTERFTLNNNGFIALSGLRVALKTLDGGAAPNWLQLASGTELGDLPIGAQREVPILIRPPADLADGVYRFVLSIEGANLTERGFEVVVTVTESGVGGVLFHIADIYTATIGANGQPVPGLANASIRLRNEAVGSLEYSGSSDSNGEFRFQDVTAGRYTYRVTAANHEEASGRLTIRPGVTLAESVFLDYRLVTVEWTVTETTIQDRYEIVLRTLFETNVPAPVLVVTPASMSIPDLSPGDVFQGEFTIKNEGLIQAQDLQLLMPRSDPYFRLEFLSELPRVIRAKQTLRVPFRLVSQQAWPPNSGNAGGGSTCASYYLSVGIGGLYDCANGTQRGVGNTFTLTKLAGSGCGGGSGGGSSGSYGRGPGADAPCEHWPPYIPRGGACNAPDLGGQQPLGSAGDQCAPECDDCETGGGFGGAGGGGAGGGPGGGGSNPPPILRGM